MKKNRKEKIEKEKGSVLQKKIEKKKIGGCLTISPPGFKLIDTILIG